MTGDKLTVSLIQGDLAPQEETDNLDYFSMMIEQIKEKTNLIVLPELFTRGYNSDIRSTAETMTGPTLNWMKTQAKAKNAVIMGSLTVKEDKLFFNRLLWIQPDGTVYHYDKRHLFRMVGEHEILNEGNEKIIVNYLGWTICPLVCYDLRFPVWSRKQSRDEYDVLIYAANWPESRAYHWKSLLIARAIENQSWVIGLNRTGRDVNDIYFRGDSLVVDPRGKVIADMGEGERVLTLSISRSAAEEYRKEFPTWMDADKFKIIE